MTKCLIDILINYVSLAMVYLINSLSFNLLKSNSLFFYYSVSAKIQREYSAWMVKHNSKNYLPIKKSVTNWIWQITIKQW